MKALIIDGEIVIRFHVVPKKLKPYFTNEPRVDLLSESERIERGILIVDIIERSYNTELEMLTNEHYDEASNTVTYDVSAIANLPTLEELAQIRLQEFDESIEEIAYSMMVALLPKILRLMKKDMPEGFEPLMDSLDAEKARVRDVIQGFVDSNDLDGLRAFKIRQEDKEYFIGEVKKFKE